MDILFYGFIVFLFAAIIFGIEGVYLWWASAHGAAAQRVTRRLQLMSGSQGRTGERISILKQRRFSRRDWLDRLLHRAVLAHRLDQLLVQSGMRWSVEQFVLCCCAALLVGAFVVAQWPVPLAIRTVTALLFALLPLMVARRARVRRLIRIEQQLPDAADFIARALRAGHSFTNVLQIVGNELAEPLSSEFRIVREEVNYGVAMSEALHNMAERVPLTDLRYLIIAVLIQRETGGNLAEILTNISHIIRSRLKLVAQVRVLSAEGRMSAWILGLLPFCVMGMLVLVNPKYVQLLWTDPAGVRLLWYALGMIVVGVLWLRKVIRIRIEELQMSIAQLSFLLIVFIIVCGLVWLGMLLFAPVALRTRLARFMGRTEDRKPEGGWTERIARAARPLTRLSVPDEGWEKSALRTRFMNAGWRNPSVPTLYFAAKSVLALLLPGVVGIVLALMPGTQSSARVLFLLLLAASCGYYLPNMVLERIVVRRKREVFETIPDALDLSTVCVEAGLSLERALVKVASEIHIKSVTLAQELQLVLMEMRAGFSKEKALRNFALRVGLDDIDALVAMLIQSERFGTSIGDALRVHSENLRNKRRVVAEEAAAKIGLKLLFPLIFCIFPTLLMVLLGPAGIQLSRVFSSALGGAH